MDWWMLGVLALVSLVKGQRETCLAVEKDPYLFFGTKTNYFYTTRDIPYRLRKLQDMPGCQPVAFWLLNRHGSHFPEADEIIKLRKLIDLRNDIVENYKNENFMNFNERMCQADIDLLSRWEWPLPSSPSTVPYGHLTSEARYSAQRLAVAWKIRYPWLLTGNEYDYLFKFANDERSRNSCTFFKEGLFFGQAEVLKEENDEKLLRPYKSCAAWTKDVENNKDILSQRFIFESKREYKEMIAGISQRLGFKCNISNDIILQMYQICRYNLTSGNEFLSPWCAKTVEQSSVGTSIELSRCYHRFTKGHHLWEKEAARNPQVFTKEDLKRLEYAEDLETYYKYGYGSPMNQKIGCSLVRDMMNFFHKHVDHDEPQKPQAMIHFTDAPMFLMTLAAIGAHRDTTPLTGDNYHTNAVQSRNWTCSKMSPFNANLAAMLYKCPVYNESNYQILLVLNEKKMNLDYCRDGICDWSDIKKKFGKVSSSCDLKFCNGAAHFNGFLSLNVTVIIFFIRFVIS